MLGTQRGWAPLSSPDALKDHPDFKFFALPGLPAAVGAIDCFHVPVISPPGGVGGFRDRKGQITQNVFCVANFDCRFSFALAGNEGTKNSVSILDRTQFTGCAADQACADTAHRAGFRIPAGGCTLADAGFQGTTECLVPFRKTRYHLRYIDR